MSKRIPSSEPIKRPWHTPQLFIIRGQSTAQQKNHGPIEVTKKYHWKETSHWHGPGANVGPS